MQDDCISLLLTLLSPHQPLPCPLPPPEHMTYMHLGLTTCSSLKETGSPFHSLHMDLRLGMVSCDNDWCGLCRPFLCKHPCCGEFVSAQKRSLKARRKRARHSSTRWQSHHSGG